MALSPPQGSTSGETSDKPIDGNRAGATDNMEEMNTIGGASDVHINKKEDDAIKTVENDMCSPNNIQITSIAETREHTAEMRSYQIASDPADQENEKTTNFLSFGTNEPRHDLAQTEPLPNPTGRVGDVASGSQIMDLDVALASNVHSMKQLMGLDSLVLNLTSPGLRHTDLSLVIKEESNNKVKSIGSTSVPLLGKLEFSAENDLQLRIGKDACGQSEERLASDKPVPTEASPTNSRIHLYRRKGKEKAFPDGEVEERMSEDEDNSQETVESCNSGGIFLTGKKRGSFEQQLIVGSKRTKKQAQDSSFMNWISNMVKGLNNANHDESPFLALTLAHPNNEQKTHDQEIITYSRNHDLGSRNMGFQSIFQSLYCSTPKEQETKMSNGESQIGGSKVFVLANEISGNSSPPIACQGENDNMCKQFSLSSEKFSHSTSVNRSDQSVKSKTLSADVAAPEMCKTSSCSDQNRTSFNLACINNVSSSSLGKYKTDSAENNDSDSHPTAKVINTVDYRGDLLGSLWITRLSPKTSGPMLNHNDQKSMYKLNPDLPSLKSKNSDAMTSVFARRLDVIKHIKPSDVKENTIQEMTYCFYCGRSGHNLFDCTELTKTERESLIRNISSFDGAEVFPCLCIRCFQLDHWAISCPLSSNSGQHQSEHRHCEVANVHTKFEKHIASSSRDNASKEKQITHLSNLVNMEFLEVPKGMFDAVRELRLSRVDILKWMNSPASLLHLNGFFLRLRLAKWEEGLGGSGYYVACITGEHTEKPTQGSRKPISVNIRGKRCLVESQYISNQDFLEDELMAWWCATMKSGEKIPSEDHLISKLEERKRLGF